METYENQENMDDKQIWKIKEDYRRRQKTIEHREKYRITQRVSNTS